MNAIMSKANISEKAKLISISLAIAKDKQEIILGIARDHFDGADLNE